MLAERIVWGPTLDGRRMARWLRATTGYVCRVFLPIRYRKVVVVQFIAMLRSHRWKTSRRPHHGAHSTRFCRYAELATTVAVWRQPITIAESSVRANCARASGNLQQVTRPAQLLLDQGNPAPAIALSVGKPNDVSAGPPGTVDR